jgi:undecaprenyl-diphosphatase
MHNFISAVTNFVEAHHYWAYALVFFLATSEALPIIGVIIPASAIIVAISALVPAGAVKLVPLIVSAAAGAILGDGFSYWLGRHYHRQIGDYWPLRRYPGLIAKGEGFFQRHGGKSVIIARFTPGVRSVVPLVAGILHMPVARFYTVNVLSAALWAPSHILAGALIGALLALLNTIAGRLAGLVGILVLTIWILFVIVRAAWRYAPSLALQTTNWLTRWGRLHDSWVARQLLALIDPAQTELRALALLGLLLIGSMWAFFGVLEDVVAGDPLVRVDAAVFHFLAGLRSDATDQLMVVITELGDAPVIVAVTAAVFGWLAWRRAWRACGYWIAAVAGSTAFTAVIKLILHHPRPIALYQGWEAFSFPSGHAAVTTTVYSFLAALIVREGRGYWRLLILFVVATWIFVIAFSRLYLGAHWLSDVLAGIAFGVSWSALLSFGYLHRPSPRIGARGLGLIVGVVLAVIGGLHIERNYAADANRYAVQDPTRTVAFSEWWTSGWMDLPARRVDIAGEYEEPLTFQWAGDLDELERSLTSAGWRPPPPWSFRSLLAWIAPQPIIADLPVLPRLQDGRVERLVMTRTLAAPDVQTRIVIYLWRSNTAIATNAGATKPLWIGTVLLEQLHMTAGFIPLLHDSYDVNRPRNLLAEAMTNRRIAYRPGVKSMTWDRGVLLSYFAR